MGRSRITNLLLAFFLIAIGVVIGIVIRHLNEMPLLETLNLVDLATLVTTIFLAVYIPEVLDRKLQVKRDKKGLILQRIDELQTFYRRLNTLIQQQSSPEKDTAIVHNLLDLCKHRLETLITLLYISGLNKSSFEAEVKKIKKLSGEYHLNLMAHESYTAEVKKEEAQLYNQIDRETSLLIFKIDETT